MRFLAWLYLKLPLWMVRLLPSTAGETRFDLVLEDVYGEWAAKHNRRANRELLRDYDRQHRP